MSKDKVVEAMANRMSETIQAAILAAVPKGAKPTLDQWKGMIKAAAAAGFEIGFTTGRGDE